MTRARRSRVKKVSVRTSVNISSRKQSIEIVGERMDDASTTRGPATRKERFDHFNNSKESKKAHVSRLTLLSRLLSCNTHPRFSVLSFFTASRSSSLVAFLLFRLPCDISLDRYRESSFSNRVTKYYKQRFVKRAASFACSSCSSCLCTLFLLYALPLRFPFAARSSLLPCPLSCRIVFKMRFNTARKVGKNRNPDGLPSFFASTNRKSIQELFGELFGGPLRLIEPAMLARTYRIAKSAWTVERRNNFRSHVARFRNSLSLPRSDIFFRAAITVTRLSFFFPAPKWLFSLLLLSSPRYPVSSLGILESERKIPTRQFPLSLSLPFPTFEQSVVEQSLATRPVHTNVNNQLNHRCAAVCARALMHAREGTNGTSQTLELRRYDKLVHRFQSPIGPW